MYHFKLTIAYDGTNYYGWQLQDGQPTVAGLLESRFKRVFGKPVRIFGSSRTDAGVHALGQVALITTDFDIDPERLRAAYNGGLPKDIHIRSVESVNSDFFPQRHVVQKTYWYHIFVKRPLPGFARYGYHHRFTWDANKMRMALAQFVGTHDFRAFCTVEESVDTVRTIDAIELIYLPHYGAYRVVVRARGFLRYMIRRMVGAALSVAAHSEFDLGLISSALAERVSSVDLPTAPAHGLVLRKILYKK